ncbi:MAG: LSM domain-containing protein [Candidatus Aenigmatarchaeota archaeon]
MADNRPLDALEKAKEKKIIVKLKSGEEIIGNLKAADLHLNLWLYDVEISNQNERKKVEEILIRGDSISYIITA